MSNPDISHNENDMYFLPSLEFFILIEETNSLSRETDRQTLCPKLRTSIMALPWTRPS